MQVGSLCHHAAVLSPQALLFRRPLPLLSFLSVVWVLPADHSSTGSHNSVSLLFGDSGTLMDRNHSDVVFSITLSQYF